MSLGPQTMTRKRREILALAGFMIAKDQTSLEELAGLLRKKYSPRQYFEMLNAALREVKVVRIVVDDSVIDAAERGVEELRRRG